jgi:putative flippase GtrA
MRRLSAQIFLFGLVGVSAMLVHMAVVWLLVEGIAFTPLRANVVGFLVAFAVSYLGHGRLTFRGHGAKTRAALPRFFLVATMGFVVNQGAYAVLLAHYGLQRYLPLLAMVLVGVAAMTFVLSRFWAFSPAR